MPMFWRARMTEDRTAVEGGLLFVFEYFRAHNMVYTAPTDERPSLTCSTPDRE